MMVCVVEVEVKTKRKEIPLQVAFGHIVLSRHRKPIYGKWQLVIGPLGRTMRTGELTKNMSLT